MPFASYARSASRNIFFTYFRVDFRERELGLTNVLTSFVA